MNTPDTNRILIVEDERALSLAIAATVRNCGGLPETAPTLAKAKEILSTIPVCGLVLDIGLPDGHGLSLLKSIPEAKRPPTIVVTAHGEIENPIAARKLGVRDFFDKPIDFEAFKTALRTILSSPPSPVSKTDSASTFIGAAPAMRHVFQKIAHACASSDPVLIIGETGTGKTTAANLITKNATEGASITSWPRPESGESITEVIRNIHSGILKIDPITSLSLDEQAELVSLWDAMPTNFPRIIATAPTNLIELVKNGDFRSDLFYRMQVLEIRLPLLRDRAGDIPVLASYFLGLQEPDKSITASDSFCQLLSLHDWPGNLRELRNVISYANGIRSGAAIIETDHLPDHLREHSFSPPNKADQNLSKAINDWLGETGELPPYRKISGELEQTLIEQLLLRFNGKLAPMAKALEANRTTLRKRQNPDSLPKGKT